jgi:hypothetical protein
MDINHTGLLNLLLLLGTIILVVVIVSIIQRKKSAGSGGAVQPSQNKAPDHEIKINYLGYVRKRHLERAFEQFLAKLQSEAKEKGQDEKKFIPDFVWEGQQVDSWKTIVAILRQIRCLIFCIDTGGSGGPWVYLYPFDKIVAVEQRRSKPGGPLDVCTIIGSDQRYPATISLYEAGSTGWLYGEIRSALGR